MASKTAPPTSELNLILHRPLRRRHRAIPTILRQNRPLGFPTVTLTLRSRRQSAETHAASDGGAIESNPEPPASPPNIEVFSNGVDSPDGYVGLFVRMLGLDNDPLDREQAIVTLWKYSQRGKNYIDRIMQFPGCINLVVSLLKSDSCSTCEAAAGLLQTVSTVNLYRDVIAKSGAVEEIIGLLFRSYLTPEMTQQCLCALWNLSIDEEHREGIVNSDLLPILIKFLDNEEIKVKEAAGGILANLALSSSYHSIMVEVGVIPKLANLLKSNTDGFKVIQKEAKAVLLELSKDEYYRILIIEEGLVRVPLVGAAAYKSFRVPTYSWPSLPDGTEIQRSSRPSRYGASELLLGLNTSEKTLSLEEAKMAAIVGRSQQQFLARIGAIEMEDGTRHQLEALLNERHTLLPWLDGIARLVLILGLEDVSAISRSAHAIADASINEYMRISFKESGAVRNLVQLLNHNNEDIKQAVTHALERLSVSHEVCHTIEAEGGLNPLIDILKQTNASEILLGKTVNILSRIFHPGKYMKTKFHSESKELLDATGSSQDTGVSTKQTDTISVADVMEREKIHSDLIPRLIELLRTSSSNLQIKIASILEYLATFERHVVTIMVSGIESGLVAVLQQGTLYGIEGNETELNPVETEETSLAIAATSRLLVKLLNFEQFHGSINSTQLAILLHRILRSNIPLSSKDWVAACLVKLESRGGSKMDLGRPIDIEVSLYETIPRLVEQMRTSFSYESREAAVLELNKIISRGEVELSRAVANAGGIFPLVELIDEASGDALEASLAILNNLSMDIENHQAIISAGAVPVLKRIALSEGPQWTRALHLLRTLPT